MLWLASAAMSAAEWSCWPIMPRVIALVVYLHVSIGGALLVSAFWSIVNERFDPHTMKRLIGRITASATLGGLLGGGAMERVAHTFGARSTLLLVVGTCLLAAWGTRRLAVCSHAASPDDREQEPVRFSGYLWTLALLMTSTAAASAFADFALKQAAVGQFGSAESLLRFFAVFYTGASLLSFLLQAFVLPALFESLGVGGALAVSPLLCVGLGVLGSIAPSFATLGRAAWRRLGARAIALS